MSNSLLQQDDDSTGVKICGLMDEKCVDVAIGAGADAIGFVFAPTSPRVINRNQADRLMDQIPDGVLAIAVLQDYPNLADFSNWNGWVQLCGDEDEDTVESSPCPVIRSFKWSHEELLRWDACQRVEALLVDGSSGGMGQRFDVTELAKLIPLLTKPVIIAGGLTVGNVAQVIHTAKPRAVDVSSGVESSSGTKDPTKICEFINIVKGL